MPTTTASTPLSTYEISIALKGLKDIKEVLYDTTELMTNFINSEGKLRDAIDARVKIENEYSQNLKALNKTYKEQTDSQQYQEELLKLQTKHTNDLLENQKQYAKEYATIIQYQKDLNKEVAYQVKKQEEGVTLNERMSHQLEGHIKGYAQIRKGLEETRRGLSSIFNVGKDLVSAWGGINQRTADYTKTIGGSAESMRKLTTETINFVKQQSIGMKYNTSMEELIKLQEDYNKSIGRSINLTNSQKETMAAMRKLAGDETTIKFTTSLENFGVNPDEAGNIVGKMFKEASDSGIAWSKYSDNFLNNIKMAQNYTFRNGLEGLQSMAKKAAEIKLDMKQASAFADKVSTLEGAVTAGANLSVLGGSFSQFGNPLTMMYEGLNDMEGLQDRMVNMFGNLGKWNSKTNMVDVSVFDKQRIKAAAQATGMDYSAIMDMIQAKGRSNQVANQLRGLNFNEEQSEYIKNTAQLDKSGKAFVTVQGEKKYLNDLSHQQLELLMKTSGSQSDNVKTIAQTLTGWNDAIEGLKKQRDAVKAGIGDIFGNQIKSVIYAIGTNTMIMAASVWGPALGKSIWGTLQAGSGMSNMGRGLGKGFSKIPDLNNPNGGNTGGFTSTEQFRSTPAGTKDSFSFLGRKMKITNTAKNGAHANYQNLRGGWNSMSADKYFALKRWGKASRVAGAVAGIGSAIGTGLEEFQSNHSLGRKIGNTTVSGVGTGVGTWLGGMLGSLILPGIGTALGSALGGWLGSGISRMLWNDERRNRFKSEYGIENLKGDYSVRQLKRFNKFKETGNLNDLTKNDRRELIRNGDFETLKAMNANFAANKVDMNASAVSIVSNGTVGGKADGGWITGPGSSRSDSVLVPTSNGEFIVNAKSAAANASLLKTINASDGPIQPRGDIMKPLQVVNAQKSEILSNVDFGKGLNINIGGSIKLDLGNKNVGNIRPEDILTQDMISKIIKEIQKQLEKGFNRDKNGFLVFA